MDDRILVVVGATHAEGEHFISEMGIRQRREKVRSLGRASSLRGAANVDIVLLERAWRRPDYFELFEMLESGTTTRGWRKIQVT